MGFGDALVGAGLALPGMAQQVLSTYHAQSQLDRQKKLDQEQRDDSVLKTLETSEDPNLRSLAVIGRMRQSQPDYKPGKKGLVNDLFSVPIEQHPEWQQLQQSVKMVQALQGAESPGAGAPPVPRATMDYRVGEDRPDPRAAALPGAAPGAPIDVASAALGDGPGANAQAGPPSMPGAGGVPTMPGASLSMPQGSMMTPGNPSQPQIPIPAPNGASALPATIPGAAPSAGPAPSVPPAAAGGPVPAGPPPSMGAPSTGVHPELESMLRQASGSSAVSDVAAAQDEAKKAFGTDVLGKFGGRGEAAFKAGAQDRITQKDILRTRAAQARDADKENQAWARQTQAATDAMARVGARSQAAMDRLLKAEELRGKRPDKGAKEPKLNTQAALLDIQRDALKDIAEVEKEVDRQLTAARLDAQKNFTNPEQVRAMEDQIRRMGEDRKKTIQSNKDASLQFLGSMGKGTGGTMGAGGGGTGGSPKGSPRKVTRDPKTGALTLAP